MATDEVLPMVYDQLYALASKQMAAERKDHTLQPTALLHEAYARLAAAPDRSPSWDSPGHFYSAAANAMRRVLVDHARKKLSQKRGGERRRIDFPMQQLIQQESISPAQLLELDEALERLEKEDSRVAELVRLRLYAGLSITDAAHCLGLSRSMAYKIWEYALCWFAVELGDD